MFDKYHALQSWNHKTAFLRELVSQEKSNKENVNPIIPLKIKDFSFSCIMTDDQGVKHRVCVQFLSKLLQTNRSKLFRAVRSTQNNPLGIDRRGRYPARATKPEDKQFVQDFLKNIPQYESKWNRSQSSTKLIHPDLSVKKLYEKYTAKCYAEQRKKMSMSYFQKIFKTFNFDFAKHRTKTSWKCHELERKSKVLIYSPELRAQFNEQLQKHLDLAKKVVDDFKTEVLTAQTSFENTEIFTFGLWRPIGLPSVEVDHTKRHLFLYQMCIFDEVRKISYIYAWPETVASKGTAEIASCILRHLRATLSPNTKHLILYCDPHHGQNRNLKLCLMLQQFLHTWNHPELKSIKQIFFVPGHGYNDCDSCFERVLRGKSSKNVFLPSHLIDNINQPERKVYATAMRKEDFLSTQPLESLLASKKVESDGQKLKWSSCLSITYNRDKPFVLSFDYGNNGNVDVLLKTQNVIRELSEINLTQLYPNGRLISKLKYNDLQEIVTLVPTEFQNFYQSLGYTGEAEYQNDYSFCARQSSDEEEEDEPN